MSKQIRLNKIKKDKLDKFARMLEQQGISVAKVILFGSYAKGKANPESDIDVAVVSTQFGQDIAAEMMLLRKIALKVDSHIEPVPLCPEDLDDPFSTLSEEIRRYGIDVGIARAPM